MASENLYASSEEKYDFSIRPERIRGRKPLPEHDVPSDVNVHAGEYNFLVRPERIRGKKPLPEHDASSENKGDIDPKGCVPYVSQVLRVRHSEEGGQVDEVNPHRGEGLPYKYTESLDELTMEYQQGKWGGLRLDLSYGAYGGQEIDKLLVFQDLVSLDLSGNPLYEGDICKLANLHLLEELHLDNLPKKGKADFAVANRFKKIKILYLRDNEISDEGARALAANTTLTTLDLLNNQIGDEGAKMLAVNKTLTSLEFRGNQIGNEGAMALAANTTLTSLNLLSNQIGAEGARMLTTNTTLTSLYLTWNLIGFDTWSWSKQDRR